MTVQYRTPQDRTTQYKTTQYKTTHDYRALGLSVHDWHGAGAGEAAQKRVAAIVSREKTNGGSGTLGGQ